jgi:hypothetical protein
MLRDLIQPRLASLFKECADLPHPRSVCEVACIRYLGANDLQIDLNKAGKTQGARRRR